MNWFPRTIRFNRAAVLNWAQQNPGVAAAAIASLGALLGAAATSAVLGSDQAQIKSVATQGDAILRALHSGSSGERVDACIRERSVMLQLESIAQLSELLIASEVAVRKCIGSQNGDGRAWFLPD